MSRRRDNKVIFCPKNVLPCHLQDLARGERGTTLDMNESVVCRRYFVHHGVADACNGS